jgi:hypothetical protein
MERITITTILRTVQKVHVQKYYSNFYCTLPWSLINTIVLYMYIYLPIPLLIEAYKILTFRSYFVT